MQDNNLVQCNICNDKHNKEWLDRKELLDALIETTKFICEDCKSDWGGGCSGICEDMSRWNRVIEEEKSREFYKGMY